MTFSAKYYRSKIVALICNGDASVYVKKKCSETKKSKQTNKINMYEIWINKTVVMIKRILSES